MEERIITLTDENGVDTQFSLLDVIEYQGADYAVLYPADADDAPFMILRAEPDPSEPEDYFFIGIESQKLIDAVYLRFQQRHPEIFEA